MEALIHKCPKASVPPNGQQGGTLVFSKRGPVGHKLVL